MTRKVIYVSFVHLTDKTSRDWYLDYLISKNVAVEYWDVVALVRDEYDEPAAKTTEYLRTFQTYNQLDQMLCLTENRDAYYVMLITYEGRFVKLYRLLSKCNAKMIFLAWGAMPIKHIQNARKIWSIFYNPVQMIGKILSKLKAIAYRNLNLVKPYEMLFTAGQSLFLGHHFAKKVIPINFVDYDYYRTSMLENKRLVVGRYAVFLDINLPYQSDLKIAGLEAVNSSDYYASLNRFFDMVESKYGVEVVIAAHPKADYSTLLFNGREVHLGQTPMLVKDADLVISHHSTSLSYAVLNKKPIIFIYTNEMALAYQHTAVKYLRDYAEYLDAAIYNIDEITQSDQIIVNDVSLKRYDNYKYSYLTTHESENEFTQEIFLREISA